jgi:hypothetical protein
MSLFSSPCFPDLESSASQDWKRHKPFCRADATRSSVDSLNADGDTMDSVAQRGTLSDDMDTDKFDGRTAGRSIDVPLRGGSTARLNSKTLGPKTMRELRKIAEDKQKH